MVHRRQPFRLSFAALIAVALLAGPSACRRTGGAVGAMKKKPGEKVGSIVFVGQKDACDCTKKRVKGTWTSLQEALKTHANVKVKRVALDVEKAEVKSLRSKRRFMTVPAVYFFNPDGKLVGMLEGELEVAQIATMLK